ncbi:MAG: DNA polymerase III subunit alpha [Candidatus Lightella neohaematopini]|nr:DNA polymerase III subunit alpha [Candidatus Lightella neohaematopini]MCV2528951.1 DNA polymerase III subunit alpha [Candidatus Lightella neohaematopini]
MLPKFIHLHVRSEYSIIDGLSNINQLVNQAVKFKMPALAITDFTNLYGVIKFYNIASNCGIKPIIGSDFILKDYVNSHQSYAITILVMNNTGYTNLIYLISKAHKFKINSSSVFIYRDWLKNYNVGLIILSGAQFGDIGQCLLYNQNNKLKYYISFYKTYFRNNFYLEITRNGFTSEDEYLSKAINLSVNQDLPLLATNNVRFLEKNDFEAHKIRVAISNSSYINNSKNLLFTYSKEQYMKNEEEMCLLFNDIPESLINSVELAKRCNMTITLGKYLLPKFDVPKKYTSEKYLVKIAKRGLLNRIKTNFTDKVTKNKKWIIYYQRLNVELNTIIKTGFTNYFLIVSEFINWAKNNNIPVGPGRGSGAGSLVAYALNITELDPLVFGLIFERFLNTKRLSMPDLDIDFCMEKRDLVINYVVNKYGVDNVAQIITFGTLTARAVIRDVGRVLGYHYNFVDKIAKLIPIDFGMTLKKAFLIKPKLVKLFNYNKDVKTILNMAFKLEGVVRNVSRHAGGIVITPDKIINFAPLYFDDKSNYAAIQLDKTDIVKIGLVKFDFLGLRTLTIINHTINMINKKNKKLGLSNVNLSDIKLNDKNSFILLNKINTNAVFQLESKGMQDLIRRLKPDSFEDIIALIALFRPGPLQSGMVDNFINRKHGIEKIYYPDVNWQHNLLKPILKSTYGIILYQEQVIQIAQILAGYSFINADILRQTISKKNFIEMSKQKSLFISNAKNNNIDENLAAKIFYFLEKFVHYGFNKSHSTAYALLSYYTLWLKANYPAEFLSSVMTTNINNQKKISTLIKECNNMNIKVMLPEINYSQYYCYVYNNTIICGLGMVNGLGLNIAKEIIKKRSHGKFKNLLDFCTRIDHKIVNRAIIMQLVKSNVFRLLKINNKFDEDYINDIINKSKQYGNYLKYQIDMFIHPNNK